MAEWKLADAENIRANLTKEQEDEISMLYRKVYLDNRKTLKSIPKDGTVSQQLQKQQLNGIQKQLDSAYKSLGVGLEKEIQKQAKKTASGVVKEATSFLGKAGFKVQGAYYHVPTEVVNALVTGQVYAGDWSLSGAIWSDIGKKQSDISKIVAEGVAANKSAYDIAKDLEKYVDPSAKKPWDWGKVYPGTSKKVDYNAQRLARTMVSHAYQQSLERVCKNNPFIDGYIWQSSSRSCPLCEERNGKFFEKGNLPMDHPNGMCSFIAHMTMSMDEIADRLGDWVNGSDDLELDTWYSTTTGNSAKPVFNEQQKKWLSPLGYTPTSMPSNFKEFASALSFSQQSELLKIAGGGWGDPHPYQTMEKYYKENLMSVRSGVEPVVEEVKPPAGLSKDKMEQMFQSQKSTASGSLSDAAENWWSGLSSSERQAVRDYTGSDYRPMNNALRGISTPDRKTKTQIKDCKSALSKASCPQDIVVGRGSTSGSLCSMLGSPSGMVRAESDGELASWAMKNKEKIIGSVAEDGGFLSATPYSGGGFTGNITYRIFVPKGSQGAYVANYSHFKSEQEFLLQAGGKFRVVDFDADYGNTMTVYMEYIKP